MPRSASRSAATPAATWATRCSLLGAMVMGMNRPYGRPKCAAEPRTRPSSPRLWRRRDHRRRIPRTEDVDAGIDGVNFLYTDVWVSMGEPRRNKAERIQYAASRIPGQRGSHGAHGQPRRPVHALPPCLPRPAHDPRRNKRFLPDDQTLAALEVTDDVFESEASVVFDQAENRMHTLEAEISSRHWATEGPPPEDDLSRPPRPQTSKGLKEQQ